MTQFQNDNLSVTVDQKPGCRITFDVQVTPLGAKAAWQKAVKEVKKEVTLPGFRKGKAPDQVILDNFSRHIEQEFKDIVINTGFTEAMSLSNCYPIDRKTIEKPHVKTISKDQGAHFTITFESRPQIPEINVADLKVEKLQEEAVTDKKVNEILDEIRFYHATWNDVDARPVQEEDYVELTIENANVPGQVLARNGRYHVKKGVLSNWIHDLIVGKSVGETVEGISEGENVLPIPCKVTINAIKTPTLPEINEEFIKKTGAESLEDLKEKITKDLHRQEQERIKNLQREQIENQLLTLYPFDIPLSLVEFELKQRTQRLENDYTEMGFSKDKIKELMDQKKESILSSILSTYRLWFLKERLIQENKISFTQQELLQETLDRLSRGSYDLEGGVKEAQEQASDYLRHRKALDFLLEKLV